MSKEAVYRTAPATPGLLNMSLPQQEEDAPGPNHSHGTFWNFAELNRF